MFNFGDDIERLFQEQLKSWDLAKTNYASLAKVKTRVIEVEGKKRVLQFNPGRIHSSTASIDEASLQARPCFFCHRPEEQKRIVYNREFEILINPYPIFDHHLTIPLRKHQQQEIRPYFEHMLLLAEELPDYFVFYNGPKCGASAPDHMHFQAGLKGALPIMEHQVWISKKNLEIRNQATFYHFYPYLPGCFCVLSDNIDQATYAFRLLYAELEIKPGDYEPMMNILAWKEGRIWIICIFPRKKARPSCYYAEGEANILISPATVEMAGLFVTPLEKDFQKVTATGLSKILLEVGMSKDEMDKVIHNITTKA
jgi:ATP adenylyltransferase/5',5'''-P-1,P-4-tetraphosphate phosphorylase II